MKAYLTVSAADPASLEAALACGAGAVVSEKAFPARGKATLWLRIGRLAAPGTFAALEAAMACAPQAIVLPAGHGRDLAHLGALLAVAEAEQGLADGSTGIIAVIDRASGFLDAGRFAGASRRLQALSWDPLALAGEVGVGQVFNGYAAPLAQARAITRLAAAAAGVPAIEAACSFEDTPNFSAFADAARRDGFAGLFCTSLDQVAWLRGEALV